MGFLIKNVRMFFLKFSLFTIRLLSKNIAREAVDELLISLSSNAGEDALDHIFLGVLGLSDLPALSDAEFDRVVNFASYERDAWVGKKAQDIIQGARILDAGAGQCRYKNLFSHVDYRAQDFAKYEGTSDGPLQESWRYEDLDYVCDINSIPVEDNCFDVVLCTEVLEHVPDPVLTLKELVRVLKPGGTLLISVPLGSGVHQEPFHFYGGFSPYFFKHHFPLFGVDVVEIQPLGGLFKHVSQEIYRVGRVLEQSAAVSDRFKRLCLRMLPQKLSSLDATFPVEQFTVGYLVEARKMDA